MIARGIKGQAQTLWKLCFHNSVRRMACQLCCVIPLSSCASALSEPTVPRTGQAVSVKYVAREWAGHNDGRVYGGVVNAPGFLSGVLGSYRGCLVDVRSRTLIVLTGAMDFHSPDGHSSRQHIFSKSILGDQTASIIELGSTFTVAGLKTKSLPSYIRLDQNIPQKCARLPLFLTESETLKPK